MYSNLKSKRSPDFQDGDPVITNSFYFALFGSYGRIGIFIPNLRSLGFYGYLVGNKVFLYGGYSLGFIINGFIGLWALLPPPVVFGFVKSDMRIPNSNYCKISI